MEGNMDVSWFQPGDLGDESQRSAQPTVEVGER